MGKRGPQSAAELLSLAPLRQARAAKRAATVGDEPSPPSHLSAEMRDFWTATLTEHTIDAHRLGTLQAACEAWDRKEQARRELGKSGLSYTDDKGMIRARPEIAIERDSRIAYLRALRELNLDIEQQKGSGLQPAALYRR
jgi:phage terminase small subunit